MRHAGRDQERFVSAGFSLEADGCGWIPTGRLFFNSKLMLEDIVAFAKRVDSSHEGDNERPPSIATVLENRGKGKDGVWFSPFSQFEGDHCVFPFSQGRIDVD